jgi:hypothetical protein
VEAARSLGDLSHMVNVPFNGANKGEFLILDIWNNIDGLNQFFANPQVHEGGSKIFKEREPVVWIPAEGFHTYHLPAPTGTTERIVATVRGMVSSRSEARTIHNALVGENINKARRSGDLSHEAYFRLTPPGEPESLEFFAVDVWMDAAGMNEYYNDPEFLSGFGTLFTAPPVIGVWQHPGGEWVEW